MDKVRTALTMCYEAQHQQGLEAVLKHTDDCGLSAAPEYAPLMLELAAERMGSAPCDYNELFCRSLLERASDPGFSRARDMIEEARAAGNSGAARQVVGRLQRDRADSVLITLMDRQSREFVAFVVGCFPFRLEDYLAEFSAGESPTAAYLVPELLDCFPDALEDTLLELYEQAAEGTVKQLLAVRLGCAPGRRIKCPAVNKFFLSLPNPREALETSLRSTADPERAALEYRVAPYHLRCLMLGRYLPAADMALLQKEDAFLTSRLGPLNTLHDADFSLPEPSGSASAGVEFANECDKCAAYGGCRQFICTCFEADSQLDDEECEAPSSWFTGSCSLCGDEIPDQYSASRIPLSHGGWKGCFCSTDCMQLDKAGTALLELIETNTLSLLS